MEMNRREFLKGLAAAALLSSPNAEAADGKEHFSYYSSELTPAGLDSQKRATISSLDTSLPRIRNLDHLRAYIPYLPHESQMYIPSPEELKDVVAKSEQQLDSLSTTIPVGKYGLFIFADAHDKKRKQRMYVLARKSPDKAQFVKAYKISLSREGFGNEKDSGMTPLGEHAIHSKTIGMFGELVSEKKNHKDDERLFTHVEIEGKDHWFVHSFGYENGNELAEVVTDQYLITGPTTSVERGVRIHGTNRSGALGKENQWISYLDGESLSTACIRMSNVDVRDLKVQGFIDVGTQVVIHATPEAMVAIPEKFTRRDPAGKWDSSKYTLKPE
jgi:hypothetical protein